MSKSTSILLRLLLAPLSWLWHGFVGSKLWGWFIVPLGVPQIGAWHAIGIIVLVGLATYNVPPESDKDELEQFARSLSIVIVVPGLTWAMGAIIHAFMA